jgi:5-methyltetrahydrofolate--homocysteine methyltransferase
MGIVNAGTLPIYEEIPQDLLEHAEDVVLNRRPDATERMIELAENIKNQKTEGTQKNQQDWRTQSLDERLQYALVKGIGDFLDEDIAQACKQYPSAMEIIEKPLMDGMTRVGQLFGEGKMFLPQVVKTARTMKKAVSILQPFIEEQKNKNNSKAGKILIATVKGDVHDIGKNIVAVILGCNNFEVIDLGVMVPAEQIIQTAIQEQVDIVCLSGLITPSLEEMCHVAEEMQKANLQIPILIGGATTSKIHTAVKIAPLYAGAVVHVKDASLNTYATIQLMNPETKDSFIEKNRAEQTEIQSQQKQKTDEIISLEEARKRKPDLFV